MKSKLIDCGGAKAYINKYGQKHKIFLANKDFTAPSDGVGIYPLLLSKKNEWGEFTESKVNQMREKSFFALCDLRERYASPSICDLWNYYIYSLTRMKYNYFTMYPQIAPIAHLIQCHAGIKTLDDGTRVKALSFYIKRNVLNELNKNKREAIKNETTMTIPAARIPTDIPMERVLFGDKKIDLYPYFEADKCAEVLALDRICRIKNITMGSAVTEAIKEYVRKYYPKDLEYIREKKKNIFEDVVFDKTRSRNKVSLRITIPAIILNDAMDYIRMYNKGNVVHFTIDDYINNALYKLNQAMGDKIGNGSEKNE